MITSDESWWAPEISAELSQGDILEQLPVGASVSPEIYLSKGSGKRGEEVWRQSQWMPDGNGIGHYLARGRFTYSLVLSHDCEIDKGQKKSNVLIAPISKIEAIADTNARQAVIEQRRYPLVPLPDVPVIGTCYADLRCIVCVNRRIISAGRKRIASLNDAGKLRLQAQLIGFFTRKNLA